MNESVTPSANPYAVSRADLEETAWVSPDEQVTEGSGSSGGGSGWAWDETRRQSQLAGGA